MFTPPARGLLMSKIELVSHGLLTTRLAVVTGGGEIHVIALWVYWKWKHIWEVNGNKWALPQSLLKCLCFTRSALTNKNKGKNHLPGNICGNNHTWVFTLEDGCWEKEDIVKGFQTSWFWDVVGDIFFPLPLWWFKIWFPQNVIAFLQHKTSE